VIPLLSTALTVAGEILRLVPDPDPVIARARFTRKLAQVVGRLEARETLTPAQAGRLAGAKAALASLESQ
jgi:hypothetical protein